tara:strand:+ start:859 stop:1131 length:273 start_codon:yes stop_codon:yes gene_type:complete
MKIERTEYIKDGFIISDGGLYVIFNRAVRGNFGGFDLERIDQVTVIEGSEIKFENKYTVVCFVSQSKSDEFENLMGGLWVEILEASPELT